MAYAVSTPVFEGPFDLLLHLISNQQVDVHEISLTGIVVAFVAELEHGVGHAEADRGDVGEVDQGDGAGRGGPLKGPLEAQWVDPGQQVGHQPGVTLVGPDPAGPGQGGDLGQAGQCPGGVLERLALEEPGQQ